MEKTSGILILAVPLLLCCADSVAEGIEEPMAADMHWRCWYDQQIHITCLLDRLPQDDIPSQPLLPSNLPPSVTVVRRNPGFLRGKIIHIPLHTQPYDMGFTASLARATVCGPRPDCTVTFSSRLPPAEEIIALLNKHLPAEADSAPLPQDDTPDETN